jgi:hypothetical protein
MRDRLAFAADCLLLGLFVTLCTLPVVTAPAGFAVACRAVHSWRSGSRARFTFDGRVLANLVAGLAFALAAGLLVVNLVLPVPGRAVVAVVSVGAFATLVHAAALVGVRSLRWLPAVRQATVAWMEHPGAMLLLTLAIGTLGVLAFVVPPMALLVGGPLALAATVPPTCRDDQAE